MWCISHPGLPHETSLAGSLQAKKAQRATTPARRSRNHLHEVQFATCINFLVDRDRSSQVRYVFIPFVHSFSVNLFKNIFDALFLSLTSISGTRTLLPIVSHFRLLISILSAHLHGNCRVHHQQKNYLKKIKKKKAQLLTYIQVKKHLHDGLLHHRTRLPRTDSRPPRLVLVLRQRHRRHPRLPGQRPPVYCYPPCAPLPDEKEAELLLVLGCFGGRGGGQGWPEGSR